MFKSNKSTTIIVDEAGNIMTTQLPNQFQETYIYNDEFDGDLPERVVKEDLVIPYE